MARISSRALDQSSPVSVTMPKSSVTPKSRATTCPWSRLPTARRRRTWSRRLLSRRQGRRPRSNRRPQGIASTGLGINPRNVESSVYDVIMNATPVEDATEPTAVRNLFVVPATIDLAGAEIELVPAFSRELKLRRALDEASGEFDFTLIDCPPSLGLLTVNGLAAAGEVLVPIQCEYYALEGLGQLLKNVALVQTNLNPRLELSAIVLTMYDARTRLAEQVAREVRDHFGETVCRSIVPRTVRLSEAPSFGQPVIVFDSSSRGALAYRELAKEVSGGTPQRTG